MQMYLKCHLIVSLLIDFFQLIDKNRLKYQSENQRAKVVKTFKAE